MNPKIRSPGIFSETRVGLSLIEHIEILVELTAVSAIVLPLMLDRFQRKSMRNRTKLMQLLETRSRLEREIDGPPHSPVLLKRLHQALAEVDAELNRPPVVDLYPFYLVFVGVEILVLYNMFFDQLINLGFLEGIFRSTSARLLLVLGGFIIAWRITSSVGAALHNRVTNPWLYNTLMFFCYNGVLAFIAGLLYTTDQFTLLF